MGEFLLLLRTKQTCIESLLRKYFIIFIALVPLPEIKRIIFFLINFNNYVQFSEKNFFI